MTTLMEPSGAVAVPSPWPPDRYELQCDHGHLGSSRDRYHFAEYAMEAARNVQRAGLAHQVVVRRLSDGAVLYDHGRGVELPASHW
ncbi:hypothetical protein [Thermoactinospora rubra]|uniref:hypothetical protein n=1 Tax=Thermoactinospora rubra TaxID=1088767 RepID=UPI000A109FA0|nr:hypothetical protein [Thermoactinospora rubra]